MNPIGLFGPATLQRLSVEFPPAHLRNTACNRKQRLTLAERVLQPFALRKVSSGDDETNSPGVGRVGHVHESPPEGWKLDPVLIANPLARKTKLTVGPNDRVEHLCPEQGFGALADYVACGPSKSLEVGRVRREVDVVPVEQRKHVARTLSHVLERREPIALLLLLGVFDHPAPLSTLNHTPALGSGERVDALRFSDCPRS